MVEEFSVGTIPTRQEYRVRPIEAADELRREELASAIAAVATNQGLSCTDCIHISDGAAYSGDGIRLSYSFPARNTILFRVDANSTGLFFGSSGVEKADALRRSLKATLSKRFQGLEYIETLKP
ncbi:hypothetical protein [Hydrocarboniphaga sp.]|uniref:hypothetical protein n=1 Tax=Hydrocarboniphaga sp. TaxID=2033016 RepID=UPI002630CEAD|nr:hypothetical protein [Hydrocarboniphaga sp.]